MTEYALVRIYRDNTHSHQKNDHLSDKDFTFNDAALLLSLNKTEISHGDYKADPRKSSDKKFVESVQKKFFSRVETRIIQASW